MQTGRPLRLLVAMACGALLAGAQVLGDVTLSLAIAAAERDAVLGAVAAALFWPLAGGEVLATGKTGALALLLRGWPAALATAGTAALIWTMSRMVAATTQPAGRCGRAVQGEGGRAWQASAEHIRAGQLRQGQGGGYGGSSCHDCW